MNSIELTAYAKINLFLKILNKRKDGYHNILTLFERISLADQIRISKIPKGITVTCDRNVTSKPQENIAYKAALAIFKYAGVESGVSIHIKKRIPIAAGLGGGSADAAAVIVGINRLFNLKIAKEKLIRLGAELGADVPFFIFDTPFAIGKDIGDRLEKVNLKAKFYHILIYPGFKLATKEVYQALDSESRRNIAGSLNCLTRKPGGDRMTLPAGWDNIQSLLHNDLEGAAVVKKPVIGRIIRRLASSLGRRVMVSGSGPSIFCLYPTRREAMKARAELLNSLPAGFKKLWQIFIVETKR